MYLQSPAVTRTRVEWEQLFTAWSQSPSQAETDRIEQTVKAIRAAIAASEKLKRRTIKVFPQGSYRNRVNVRRDSDVDVGVMCSDFFLSQYPLGKRDADFGNVTISDYGFAQFKNEVEEALVDYFGRLAVTRGNKAFDIKAKASHVEADVVPLFEFRQYFDSGSHRCGVALIPDRGGRIENYPERLVDSWPSTPLHYENGITKNDQTSHRFKGMVRIIKSLKNMMCEKGVPSAQPVPGYLIECLTWNASNTYFSAETWDERVRSTLLHLWHSTYEKERCEKWTEVDDIKYLFHSSQPWTREQANTFLWDAYQAVEAGR